MLPRHQILAALGLLGCCAALLCGCSSQGSAGHGTMRVHAVFGGRVPGGGQPLVVGVADASGRVVETKKISPRGGIVTFRVAAGQYKVLTWMPGTKPEPKLSLCSAKSIVSAGQSKSVTLECVWH